MPTTLDSWRSKYQAPQLISGSGRSPADRRPATRPRIPHSHRYTVTDHGLHTARFLTCVHDRFLPTGLALLADHTPSPLRAASHAYNDALGNLSRTTGLAV